MNATGAVTRPICRNTEQMRNVLRSGGIMGIAFLKVKVVNPQRPKNSRMCEFLVDSGAVYSVVPQKILKLPSMDRLADSTPSS